MFQENIEFYVLELMEEPGEFETQDRGELATPGHFKSWNYAHRSAIMKLLFQFIIVSVPISRHELSVQWYSLLMHLQVLLFYSYKPR